MGERELEPLRKIGRKIEERGVGERDRGSH